MSELPEDRLGREIAQHEARLNELEAERAAVEERLAELRREQRETERSTNRLPVVPALGTPRTKHEKVALFRSLFRAAGRTP